MPVCPRRPFGFDRREVREERNGRRMRDEVSGRRESREKLPRARAIAKEAEATDSETQLGRRLAVPDGRRGFLGA